MQLDNVLKKIKTSNTNELENRNYFSVRKKYKTNTNNCNNLLITEKSNSLKCFPLSNNYFSEIQLNNINVKSEKHFLNSKYKYKRRKLFLLNEVNYILLIISELLKYLRSASRYVQCMKMLNNCPLGIFLLLGIIMTLSFPDITEAGTCWTKRMDNGKCKELYSNNITREECCGRSQEFGFTEKDLSDVELFFVMAVGEGANCVSCLDSCDLAKCGIGKRCAIRKGRPKCICAPICKSSKDKKPIKISPIRVIDVKKQQDNILQQFNFGDIITNNKKLYNSINNDNLNLNKRRRKRETTTISELSKKIDENLNNKFASTTPTITTTTTIINENNNNNNNSNNSSNSNNRNQRNSIKKRKLNHDEEIVTTPIIPPIDVEHLSSSPIIGGKEKIFQHSKNDKIIITSEIINSNKNYLRHENSIKRKKNNPNHQNSKNIVKVQNNSGIIILDTRKNTEFPQKTPQHQQQQQHQHHSRHQYKKQRKFKEQQRAQNGTIGRRKKLQKQNNFNIENHQENSNHHGGRSRDDSTTDGGSVGAIGGIGGAITLDEKIRNGFFNYGFPYPSNDLTQITHGRYYNPVCGTDGKTYKTECQLKKRACRRDITSLTVAYRGHCQTSCKLVKCLHGLTCVEDQYGIPHCIACTITCPKDDESSVIDPRKAVCGVDGRTYKSICDINRLICTTGRSIAVAYYGPCQDAANCDNIQCGEKKICLNDLVTHKPRCISCSFKCPRRRRPQGQRYEDVKICGNNNHTYSSWCQMRRDSCNTGFYIDVRHAGPCYIDSFSTNLGIY